MKLPYTTILQRDEDGDIIARVKELEGCVADGQDEMEAIGHLQDAKELWIAAALKADLPIPKPEGEDELPSGKWLQRVPRSLHKKLVDLAKNDGVSLNQLVLSILAEAAGQKLQMQKSMPDRSVIDAIDANGYAPASTRCLSLVHYSAGHSSSRSAISSQSIEFAVGLVPGSAKLNTPLGVLSKSLADRERIASGY